MRKTNWCSDYLKKNACKPENCAECPYAEDKVKLIESLTLKEKCMLVAVKDTALSFCGEEGDFVWTSVIFDGYCSEVLLKEIGSNKSVPGLLGSLHQKGLVLLDGDPGDETCAVSKIGLSLCGLARCALEGK